MPTQVIEEEVTEEEVTEEELLTFDQLDTAAQHVALQKASEYEMDVLTWDYFQDSLQDTLNSIGLSDVDLIGVADEDGRYGRDAMLEGALDLTDFGFAPKNQLRLTLTPQELQRTAPLIFELIQSSFETPIVTLTPQHRSQRTQVEIEDRQTLEIYLEDEYLEELHIEQDDSYDELIENLLDQLHDEYDELEGVLQNLIDDIGAHLHNQFTETIEFHSSEENLKQTSFISDGLFTPDGERVRDRHS